MLSKHRLFLIKKHSSQKSGRGSVTTEKSHKTPAKRFTFKMGSWGIRRGTFGWSAPSCLMTAQETENMTHIPLVPQAPPLPGYEQKTRTCWQGSPPLACLPQSHSGVHLSEQCSALFPPRATCSLFPPLRVALDLTNLLFCSWRPHHHPNL